MFDMLGGHIRQGKYDIWLHAFGKSIQDEYMDNELSCYANTCSIDCYCVGSRSSGSERYETASSPSTALFKSPPTTPYIRDRLLCTTPCRQLFLMYARRRRLSSSTLRKSVALRSQPSWSQQRSARQTETKFVTAEYLRVRARALNAI